MRAKDTSRARPAPLHRRDVRDRLREDPLPSGEVLGGVLPLAEGVVGGPVDDARAAALGALAVRVDVGDADHDAVLAGLPFAHDHGAVADVQLRAMVADADAQREAELGAKPVDGGADVRIRQLGDDSAVGDGAVAFHRRSRAPISANDTPRTSSSAGETAGIAAWLTKLTSPVAAWGLFSQCCSNVACNARRVPPAEYDELRPVKLPDSWVRPRLSRSQSLPA